MDSYEGQGSDPSSLHKYTYCGNNPANAYDPTGNSEFEEMMVAGAIRGSIAGSFWGMFNSYVHGGTISDILAGGVQGAAMGAMFGAVPVAAWGTPAGKVIIALFSAMGLTQAVSELEAGYVGMGVLDAMLSLCPMLLTPTQMTLAITARETGEASVVFARVQKGKALYVKLNGAIGEEQGFQKALANGEFPIQGPKPTTMPGPDYITLSKNNEIFVYDAKYRSSGGKYPSIIPSAKMSEWMTYVRIAIDNMPDGPQKEAARKALNAGKVQGLVFKWPN